MYVVRAPDLNVPEVVVVVYDMQGATLCCTVTLFLWKRTLHIIIQLLLPYLHHHPYFIFNDFFTLVVNFIDCKSYI